MAPTGNILWISLLLGFTLTVLCFSPWGHFNKRFIHNYLPQRISFGVILAKIHVLFFILEIVHLPPLNLSEKIFSILVPSFFLPLLHLLKEVFLSQVFQQIFSVKGHLVNILGCLDHRVIVTTTTPKKKKSGLFYFK